jgi:excisionase family DNA binding protein
VLPVDEFAARLRVSPDTVRRLIRDGKLRAFQYDGKNSTVRVPA